MQSANYLVWGIGWGIKFIVLSLPKKQAMWVVFKKKKSGLHYTAYKQTFDWEFPW